MLEKLLASEGVELPKQMIECGSIEFTKALVAASDHLAMLPEHAAMSKTGRKYIKAPSDNGTCPEPRYRSDISRAVGTGHFELRLIRQIENVGADLSRELIAGLMSLPDRWSEPYAHQNLAVLPFVG